MQALHISTLKELNLKATPKRMAILTLMGQQSTYTSPEDIWLKLKGEFKRIGLPTVYRNLEELAEGGIITKVIHANRQLYYYYCTNRSHHHHFVCVACRKVEDVAFCGMEKIEREIGERMGGTVLSHVVQVNGLCRVCSAGQDGGSAESGEAGQ